MGRWMGPRTGLDAVGGKKSIFVLCYYRESNP